MAVRFKSQPKWFRGFMGCWVLTCAVLAVRGQTPAQSGAGIQRRTGSNADDQAQAAARRFWDRVSVSCGDSYYLDESAIPGSGKRLVEAKGVSFHAVRRELSDAERMNGYEWRGNAVMSATATRERDKEARAWLAWRDVGAGLTDQVANAIETVSMERAHGHWFYVFNGSGMRTEQLTGAALTCGSVVSGIHSRSEGDPLQDCLDKYSAVVATASFVPLFAGEMDAIRGAKLTLGDALSEHRDAEGSVFGKTWDKRSKNPETLVKGMGFTPVLSNPEIAAGEDGHNYAGFEDHPALWVIAKLGDGRIGLIDWGEARDPKGRRPVIAQQFSAGAGRSAGSPKIEVYAPGKRISAPEIMREVQPEYTDKARAKQIEGTVTLSAVIDKDGRAQQIEVVRSLGLGLDEQAIKAVAQWTFIPALRDGRAVPVSVTFEVHFLMW